jgi:hypothetical protein
MIRQPEYEKECRWIRASMRDWIEQGQEEEINAPLSEVLELLTLRLAVPCRRVAIIDSVLSIMEGGKEAFLARDRRYHEQLG